jgi:hypothetical protein
MNISISITLTDDEREILLGLIKKNKYAQAASAILYLAHVMDDVQNHVHTANNAVRVK